MKHYFSILFFILTAGSFQSQMTVHPMIHAGYVYQNQSFGEVGGRLLFLSNDDMLYRIGASAVIGSANSDFAIMPKIQGDILLNFERNVDINHSYYFLAGAEATTHYAAPKIGISLFGIVDVSGGYAFSLNKKGINGKELKGLNFNFTLNIPLVAVQKGP
ncbi:MAG: hypothetical protein QM564_04445 [Bergeyella sp.]